MSGKFWICKLSWTRWTTEWLELRVEPKVWTVWGLKFRACSMRLETATQRSRAYKVTLRRTTLFLNSQKTMWVSYRRKSGKFLRQTNFWKCQTPDYTGKQWKLQTWRRKFKKSQMRETILSAPSATWQQNHLWGRRASLWMLGCQSLSWKLKRNPELLRLWEKRRQKKLKLRPRLSQNSRNWLEKETTLPVSIKRHPMTLRWNMVVLKSQALTLVRHWQVWTTWTPNVTSRWWPIWQWEVLTQPSQPGLTYPFLIECQHRQHLVTPKLSLPMK